MQAHKKIAEACLKLNLNLNKNEEQEINSRLSKASFDTDESWVKAIESLAEAIRNNPLKKEAQRSAAAKQRFECPVCGNTGEQTTLINNRKAYYCAQHRIVIPEPIAE